MVLKNLPDIPLKATYSSLETNLIKDVVAPLLQASIKYDRGVGFFTSGWLKEAAKGLLVFVKQGGKARIITSPNLSAKDWQTIQGAEKEKQHNLIIKKSIENGIQELEKKLQQETLIALAWLIRDGVLDFRFAIPQKELGGGIFHSKLSLFTDEQHNEVALHGSQNDSHQASLNEESYSVFCSWNEGKVWHAEHRKRFDSMWDDSFENLQVLKVQDAEKSIIIRNADKFPRPYPFHEEVPLPTITRPMQPTMSSAINLRDYQKIAISEWELNSRHGIYEMATGTGKTITAIAAAVDVFEKEGRLALIVLVPYIHLVDQWVKDLHAFGFDPVRCYESKTTWKQPAGSAIREFNAGLVDHICFVTTHQTASMDTFQNIMRRLHSPYLLLGDEIHELGSHKFRKGLLQKATWRIGLSATPDRWYDEEGTSVLRSYFGKTVIEYDLKHAIEEKHLTPYHYFPEQIDFTQTEAREYKRLTASIAKLSYDFEGNKSKIESLLRRRADLIGKAENKIPHLLNILEQHRQECEYRGELFQHILIYCNKGTHREVLQAVNETGLRTHEFVHDVDLQTRAKVLKSFSQGDIDCLVAIRCLDQGVDVPATKRAYILASSTNPREFVQRRGRILRKSKGKSYAVVYDFLVGPWESEEILGRDAAKGLLSRELPRFAEFSLDADNSQQARDTIWETVKSLNLVPSLRKRPWEVYQENQHS
jgi:superfamily II DNA or RNA helicase